MVVMILGLIGVAGGALSAGCIGPLVGGGACGAILYHGQRF